MGAPIGMSLSGYTVNTATAMPTSEPRNETAHAQSTITTAMTPRPVETNAMIKAIRTVTAVVLSVAPYQIEF